MMVILSKYHIHNIGGKTDVRIRVIADGIILSCIVAGIDIRDTAFA